MRQNHRKQREIIISGTDQQNVTGPVTDVHIRLEDVEVEGRGQQTAGAGPLLSPSYQQSLTQPRQSVAVRGWFGLWKQTVCNDDRQREGRRGRGVAEEGRNNWVEKDDRSGTTSLPLLSVVPHTVTAGKACGWSGLWKQRG